VAGPGSGPSATGVGQIIVGTYGRLTVQAAGGWSYALDNDDPDTQALGAADRPTDLFTYTVADALGATSFAALSIRVNGADDLL
jgi:VCBS repeat-containing protein